MPETEEKKKKGKWKEKIKQLLKSKKRKKAENEAPTMSLKRTQQDLGIPNIPGVTKRTDYTTYKKGGKIRDAFKQQYD